MDNVPALRRKLQRVQVSNLNLTRELERAERMLKAQVCAGLYQLHMLLFRAVLRIAHPIHLLAVLSCKGLLFVLSGHGVGVVRVDVVEWR